MLLHKNSNLNRTVFSPQDNKTMENRKRFKAVLLETINLRNSTFAAVPGEVSSEGSDVPASIAKQQ